MGYIRAHWEGDNSLAYAYWANGVALQLALHFILLFVIEHSGLINTQGSLYTLVALQLAVSLWAMVGIWRSAGNSIALAKKEMRYPIWAYLARVAVVMGAIRVLADFAGVSQN